jgi:hypothetical protein
LAVIAGVYNINLDQGATFERLITVRNSDDSLVDLNGYTARMHIRLEFDDDNFIALLTTENGRIVLGGSDGTVFLTLPPEVTSILRRDCVYDLELIETVSGKVYRLLRGMVRVSGEVTR